MLVPRGSHSRLVGGGQLSKPTRENTPLSGNESIEPGYGRRDQPRLRPVGQRYVERAGAEH